MRMAILFNYFFAAWQVFRRESFVTKTKTMTKAGSKAAGESVFDAVNRSAH